MKYKSDSLESNIVNAIYDTLAGNGCYPQFQAKQIDDGDVTSTTGEIEFNYQLNKIYQGGKAINIKPKPFNILITVDIFPTEG
jgi:hypothetical protein